MTHGDDPVFLRRLRWSVEHAVQHVAHYQPLAAHLPPGWQETLDATTLADLPLTTKGDLRAHPMLAMSAVPREELVRVLASSGTTGPAVLVGETRNDASATSASLADALAGMGVPEGAIVAILHGSDRLADALALQAGVTRAGRVAFALSGDLRPQHLDQIVYGGAAAIMATPSQMVALHDALERAGFEASETSLRAAFVGGEPMSDALLRWIERKLGVEVADLYGLAEFGGPGIAMGQEALTVAGARVHAEIIDPDTGATLAEEEQGELVLTTLATEGFPLLRFRTRDLTALRARAPGGPQIIERIAGRLDDVIDLRGRRILPTEVETELLAEEGMTPHYRILRERDGPLDRAVLEVEGASGLPAERLAGRIAERFGTDFTARVLAHGTLPRSRGRLTRCLDQRGD